MPHSPAPLGIGRKARGWLDIGLLIFAKAIGTLNQFLVPSIATGAAPDLYDPLPDRDCAVFDFEPAFGIDSYGSDMTDASNNASQSAAQAKFGANSGHVSSTTATGYAQYGYFGDFMGLNAWSDKVAMVAWVRFGSITTGTDQIIFRIHGDSNDYIQVRLENTSGDLELWSNNNGSVTTQTHGFGSLSADTWYLIGFYYDGSTTVKVTVNDDEDSFTITQPTGTAAQDLIVGDNDGSPTMDMFVDDLLICVGVTIADGTFVNHYNRNIPWSPYGVTVEDIVLNVGTTGAAHLGAQVQARPRVNDTLEAAISHIIGTDQRPTTPAISGSTASSWTDADFGDGVDYGARGVQVFAILVGDTAGTNQLEVKRSQDSATDANQTRVLSANIAANDDVGASVFMIVDSVGRTRAQLGAQAGNGAFSIDYPDVVYY